jgi:NADH-quinone oxidoreductase subunit E
MSEKLINQHLSEEQIKELDLWVSKYPKEEKQSAVMQALMIVQQGLGYLTKDAMDAVADYLEMPPIAVYEVASFYTMYEHQPRGRHLINVCTNVSCMLRQSDKVLAHLEKKLKIKLGETSRDGRFTLRAVECLGACVNAPMMQVNTDYHEQLTTDKIDALLEHYE